MKKFILCASVVALGAIASCSKDELVPEGTTPEWLGESIYEELQQSEHLTGTFNTYLRLVDDLDYAEVLSRTGSKTIFPANDEAFERFFQSNPYGVSSYEQLTDNMKKQLLYSSMLDNAMLTSMLSNVEQGDNGVSRGVALKHETNISVTDSITTILNAAMMPQNNTYWDEYRVKGINVVYDATKPMMVHFTREQMLANTITTTGVDSDFGILRGEPVGTTVENSDTAYIFQTKIINQDVTCTNGYVHQVQDVLVPPGNIGQALRSESNTTLFSRILDYHCAPYYDQSTTNDYNAWALSNGQPTIDSIFQVRYFSAVSQSDGNVTDPTGTAVASTNRLNWDPGWNQYVRSGADNLGDIGAILVPVDDAVEEYFLPGGGGSYFIELYGTPNTGLENTAENLPANLDALYNNGNGILTSFVNNLMQTSFVASVPSKFGTITNQGSGDFMGLTVDDIAVTDGKYDVVVANNGVIYKMKEMIAPDEYQSVIGPALIYPDLSVIGYFTQDRTTGATSSIFGADMYYYLMAMQANYVYFIPSNDGLAKCYIDPISLGSANPRALEFYYHIEPVTGTDRTQTLYGVKMHNYNIETGEISEDVYSNVTNIVSNGTSEYKAQVYDLLNYNTLVLDEGEELENEYYLTKHGGAIRLVDFKEVDGEYSGKVYGGAQIDNGAEPANIEAGWKEKNGYAFRLDNVIQPALTSVYGLLSKNESRFTEFLDMCAIFDDTDLLEWAGISSTPLTTGATAPQERYIVFSGKSGKALDQNINFFNGYNYTFYAPNNDAMTAAYALGLPHVDEINEIYEKYGTATEGEYPDDEITDAKATTLNMLMALRAFVRYHFQNNSVFADKYVEEVKYQSLYSSDLGIPYNITIKSVDGILTVTDNAGRTITIDANGSLLVNKMTRDYEFDEEKTSASSIAVSSCASVHEVSTPLVYSTDGRYDASWSTASARQTAAKNYKELVNIANNFKD